MGNSGPVIFHSETPNNFALQSDDGKPGPIGVHRDSTFITEEFMPAPPLFGMLGVGVVVRWGALYKVLKINVFIDLHSKLTLRYKIFSWT